MVVQKKIGQGLNKCELNFVHDDFLLCYFSKSVTLIFLKLLFKLF